MRLRRVDAAAASVAEKDDRPSSRTAERDREGADLASRPVRRAGRTRLAPERPIHLAQSARCPRPSSGCRARRSRSRGRRRATRLPHRRGRGGTSRRPSPTATAVRPDRSQARYVRSFARWVRRKASMRRSGLGASVSAPRIHGGILPHRRSQGQSSSARSTGGCRPPSGRRGRRPPRPPAGPASRPRRRSAGAASSSSAGSAVDVHEVVTLVEPCVAEGLPRAAAVRRRPRSTGPGRSDPPAVRRARVSEAGVHPDPEGVRRARGSALAPWSEPARALSAMPGNAAVRITTRLRVGADAGHRGMPVPRWWPPRDRRARPARAAPASTGRASRPAPGRGRPAPSAARDGSAGGDFGGLCRVGTHLTAMMPHVAGDDRMEPLGATAQPRRRSCSRPPRPLTFEQIRADPRAVRPSERAVGPAHVRARQGSAPRVRRAAAIGRHRRLGNRAGLPDPQGRVLPAGDRVHAGGARALCWWLRRAEGRTPPPSRVPASSLYGADGGRAGRPGRRAAGLGVGRAERPGPGRRGRRRATTAARSRSGTEPRTAQAAERDVDAYAMVFRGGHWYLVGFDRDRDDVRAFRLSRFTTESPTSARGSEPPDGFTRHRSRRGRPMGGDGRRHLRRRVLAGRGVVGDRTPSPVRRTAAERCRRVDRRSRVPMADEAVLAGIDPAVRSRRRGASSRRRSATSWSSAPGACSCLKRRRAAPTTAERLGRMLVVVPYLVQHPGSELDEVAQLFDVPADQLRRDLDLLFMSGLPPYGPGDLIDVDVDEDDRIWITMADHFARPLRLTRNEALALLPARHRAAGDPGVSRSSRPGESRWTSSGIRSVPRSLGHDGRCDRLAASGQAPTRSSTLLREAASGTMPAWRSSTSPHPPGDWSTRRVDPEEVFSDVGTLVRRRVGRRCGRANGCFRADRIRRGDAYRGHVRAAGPRGRRTRRSTPPGPTDVPVRLLLRPAARWIAEYYVTTDPVERADGSLEVTLPVSDLETIARPAPAGRRRCRVLDPPELADDRPTLASVTLARYR